MSLFIHRALGHFLMNESGADGGDGGGALDINTGAAAFAALLEPPAAEEPGAEQPELPVEPEVEPELEPEVETSEQEEELQTFTVKIDGKEVQVPLSELLNGYQRQSDYTKKTMEAAEQRKTADAEVQKAQQERQQYAGELQRMAVQLEGVLEQQSQIDWAALIESDPVEYLKQQQLFQQRQALYQKNMQEQQQLAQQFQTEQAQAHQSYLAEQQENLLAKLPDWKDDAKAAAEKTAISKFLKDQGFGDEDISSIADHRHVIIARKAMLYDQVMANAKLQAKKVQEAPQRVVKPGVNESRHIDGRSSAAKRHEKGGTVETGAAVFAQLL
jgi:hypothetical protein